MVGSDGGVGQVVEGRALLQPAGLAHRADPLDPAAAALGLGAVLCLAHDHRVAQRAFGGVVGGVDPGRLAEGPQRLVLGQQPGAEVGGPLVAGARACAQQRLDPLAQRGELGGQPGEVVALLQVGAVAGDHRARRAHELAPELPGGAGALGDLGQLPDDMAPAKLLLEDVEEAIAGVAVCDQEVRDDDAEDVKALSREQLDTVLALAPARHRTLIELLAATGLRVSEGLALERRHLAVDGARPHVRVRRAFVKGRVEPPKSRHGRRDVPLSRALVNRLRSHLADLPDVPEALVFATRNGTSLDADNLRRRVVKPLMEEAGAPWAAFHTLRHTYASLQLASGVNVVQVSRALGHHSAAFTLDTYVHLLEGEEAPPLDLGTALDGTRVAATPADPQNALTS